MPKPALLEAFAAHTAAAGGFTPLDLPNLVGWYDFSDTGSLTVDGSNRISQINDLSGAADHLTQATEANMPTANAATINSLHAGRFTTAQSLSNTSFTACNTNNTTILMVVLATDTDLNQQFCRTYDGSGNNIMRCGHTNGNAARQIMDFFGSDLIGTASVVAASCQVTFYGGSTNVRRIYVNGALDANSTAGGSSSGSRFQIGHGGGTLTAPGDYGEFIVCNTALSDADREAAEDYLKAKWGTP